METTEFLLKGEIIESFETINLKLLAAYITTINKCVPVKE